LKNTLDNFIPIRIETTEPQGFFEEIVTPNKNKKKKKKNRNEMKNKMSSDTISVPDPKTLILTKAKKKINH